MRTNDLEGRPGFTLRFFARILPVFALLLSLMAQNSAFANTATAPALADACSSVSLVATEDTYLSAANPSYNYGNSQTLYANGPATGSSLRTSLLKWNPGAVPADAYITSASISLTLTYSSVVPFNLYALRRDWVEGSGNGSSGSGASWTFYGAGSGRWDTAGAANVDTDRYDTNLWVTDASTFATTGRKEVLLNASSYPVIENWIDDPLTNHGLMIQRYTSTATDELTFYSSEATAANRPTLNLTYCQPSAEPTITVAGSLLPFTAQPGIPSPAQTYTLSAANLTGPLTITAPVGFELALDDLAYSPSLTLPADAGQIPTTTIYVRLNSPTEGSFSGDIAHTSPGAVPTNLSVTGSLTSLYTLTLNISGDGAVALDPPGGVYSSGVTVTLAPSPAAGHRFTGWSGADAAGVIETGGVYTLLMDRSQSITANFQPLPQYPLEVAALPTGAGSVTLEPSAGSYAEGTLVHLTAAPAAGYDFSHWSGDLSGVDNPASVTMDGPRSVTAIFTPHPECHSASLNPVADTWINGADLNQPYNYGASSTLEMHAFGAGRHALLRWDLTSLPPGVEITSAAVTFFTVDTTVQQFHLYEVAAGWAEGAGEGAPLTPGATWNTRDGLQPWQTPGARGALDRGDTDLWQPSGFSFSTGGLNSVTLNPSGLAVLQNWLNGAPNHGFTIQNYAAYSGGTDPFIIYSREANTAGNRPRLDLTYCTGGADYLLSITTGGEGSVLADPPGPFYQNGQVVILTPLPAGGHAFAAWAGANAADLTAQGNGSWSLLMDGDKFLSVSFLPLPPNQPPAITEGASLHLTISEDGQPDAFDLTLHAVDPDPNDILTWSVASPAGHGLAAASGTGQSIAVGYSPFADYFGPDSFIVQVCDGHGGTDQITLNITLAAVNDPPVITAGPTAAVHVSRNGAPTPFSLSLTAADIDGPALTWSLASPPAHGLAAAAGSGPSIAVEYLPGIDYTGSDSFIVQISDGSLVDTIQVEVTVSADPTEQRIQLSAGWNLVSLNLHPASTAVGDVLASIAGNYDLVYAWDASGAHPESGHWLRADNLPATPDTLLALDERTGFWLHALAPATLVVTGLAPASTSVSLLDTAGGWNLAAYPSARAGALPAVLADNGIGEDGFSLVYSYQPSGSSDPWRLYDRAGPTYANDLDALTPGLGYWIRINANAVWNVPYDAN